MIRLLSYLSWFFFALAAVLFAAAAYFYFLPEDVPGALVDEPDREFPRLAVGENEVSFRLRNPTRHPVRVVGYQFC
jgi:hypothetical protein